MLAGIGLAIAMTLQQDIPVHVATTPADRLGEQWWRERHEQKVAITKAGGVDLAFLGDSITHSWEGPGQRVWDHYYANRRAADFGFSGDRTEHVLWRLAHGELVGLSPKVVVVMIGTNNIGHGSSNPQQTADGVRAIVATLRRDVPAAKVLLLGIFPRGLNGEDPMRKGVAQATEAFKALADGENVVFLDIGRHFLRPGGEMRTLIVPDLLHPNEAGYTIWARAMEDTLSKMLGDRRIDPPDLHD